MILVDANLLIYAKVVDLPQHRSARAWLESALVDPAPVGLPWPVLLAFLRIVTNPRVFQRPLPLQAAWSQVEEWLTLPGTWIPRPMERHGEILGRLLEHTRGQPNLIPDAHLAALAIEHGLVLHSTDGDFARFPGLSWQNPLAA